MKNKRKNAFTLVELLAVLVILAVILVIAIPKVMSIIKDVRIGTLESTAKLVALSAEKKKVENEIIDNTEILTCDSVAKINKGDYASCSIEFENNTAKVTIEGSGKFDGLYVCGGTKTRNWLTPPYLEDYWTITVDEFNDMYAAFINEDGRVWFGTDAYNLRCIRPTLYLSHSVKIISGNGDTEPYILAM